MPRKNWSLSDDFNKTGMYSNMWEEWDSKDPSERAEIESRFERNRSQKAISRLKKGTYGDKDD